MNPLKQSGIKELTEIQKMDEIALLKAAKVLWHSVITSAGSTLTWEEASQQHRDMAIEHARRAIMTYLDNAKPRG